MSISYTVMVRPKVGKVQRVTFDSRYVAAMVASQRMAFGGSVDSIWVWAIAGKKSRLLASWHANGSVRDWEGMGYG